MAKKSKLTKKVKKMVKRVVRKKIRRQLRRPLVRRKRLLGKSKGIAMASTKGFSKDFKILLNNGTTMIVGGRDLIYPIPDNLVDQTNATLMTVIPANPCYWMGTRVGALAAGYQNYVPLYFKVTYVPQCAVTQQGVVLGGTLWAMAPNFNNIQQTLKTSNGGILTQCYKGANAVVALGSNLQFKLFRTGGEFDQEANPFNYVALSIATTQNNDKIVPGYFYVTYKFKFMNPIGSTVTYYNSGLITKSSFNPTAYKNSTAVNCQNLNYPTGAVIQVDRGVYKYNGEEVNFADSDHLWYFCNEPNSAGNDVETILYFTHMDPVVGGMEVTVPGDGMWVIDGTTQYGVHNWSEYAENIVCPQSGVRYDCTLPINAQAFLELFTPVAELSTNVDGCALRTGKTLRLVQFQANQASRLASQPALIKNLDCLSKAKEMRKAEMALKKNNPGNKYAFGQRIEKEEDDKEGINEAEDECDEEEASYHPPDKLAQVEVEEVEVKESEAVKKLREEIEKLKAKGYQPKDTGTNMNEFKPRVPGNYN